jgi:hypothetical protein
MTTVSFIRIPSLALVGMVSALALAACNKTADTAASDGSASLVGNPGGQVYAGGQSYVSEPAGTRYRDARPPEAYADRAPPPLPGYDQPPIPGEGYIWIPGYWAWNASAADYYWTPGTWARPPRPGVLWTPGYWRYRDGRYAFVGGYWAPKVGFYGGVNYGYGYAGSGYRGGRWEGDHFRYNAAVNNLVAAVAGVAYREAVDQPRPDQAMTARPSDAELQAAQGPRFEATPEQMNHAHAAFANPGLAAGANQGRPSVVATVRPGEFQGQGVVTVARQNPAWVQAPAHPAAAPGPAMAAHPGAMRPAETPPGAMGPGDHPRHPGDQRDSFDHPRHE